MKKVYLTVLLLLASYSAFAKPVLVEFFYLPHRPAEAVVAKAEQALSGMNLTIRKYSFDDSASKKLIDKYKLHSHMPVAIFINGSNKANINGRTVEFRNFPKGDAFVPNFEGGWTYEDLKKAAEAAGGKK
jgi:hypothetical protein